MVLNLFEDWVPMIVLDALASLSFLAHFSSISKGVLSLQDVFYFVSVIVAWLAATMIVLEIKRAS
jgi:ABC-2 type transport system permease protein